MISVRTIALACLLVAHIAAADDSCVPYEAEYGTVCVCNATYCDTAGSVPDLADGEYVIITSSESGQRFNVTNGTTTLSHIPHNIVDRIAKSMIIALSTFPQLTYISVDPRITYQEIEGFGGTFTDAAGLNILNISSEAQENLLKSYFGADGLNYTLGRVPIGGADYSTRPYTLQDYPVNDTNLSNFTLAEEDYTLKIALIKRAQALASDEIHLMGATWSPPVWMKTNNKINGYSLLLSEYEYAYALYHVKFLQEYSKENVTIHALSTGNQPIVSPLGDIFTTNSLGWVPEDQAKWIINYFGPMVKEAFPDTKIYLLDEQTPFIDDMLPILLEDDAILPYIDGVALHFYLDSLIPLSLIDKVYDLLGNVSIINTEASMGAKPDDFGVKTGKWSRAEFYLYYVIEKLKYNVNGWMDWNMAMNLDGGPSWNGGTVDAFIMVDADNDQFFKNPLYYAFGHVSKYVPRGSKRIASSTVNGVPNVAFKRPDGLIAVVALNNGTVEQTVSLDDVSTGQFINFTMEPNSMSTFVYKPKNLL